MIKGIIFDLDGTLLDTIEDLADSVNAALSEVGKPGHDTAKVQSFVGNGMVRLVERALGEPFDPELVEQVLARFKEHYARLYTNKTVPYPGLKDVVDISKAWGLKLGVCSNKANKYVKPLIDLHFGSETFDFVLGEVDYIPRKPDPAMALEVAANMGVRPSECLYVGDSTVDIQTGKAAAMPVCAVSYGFQSEALLETFEPHYMVHDADGLLGLIKALI